MNSNGKTVFRMKANNTQKNVIHLYKNLYRLVSVFKIIF